VIFKTVVPDEYYLFSSDGYAFAVRMIVAMAADDVTNVNVGFKQFVTAVSIYAAINPDKISIMCRNVCYVAS